MIIKSIDPPIISPEEGKRLTNGDVIAERDVYIGVGDKIENWYEITEEEAEKILEERRASEEIGQGGI